jgi:PhzF family phenazine biosynthesis protein
MRQWMIDAFAAEPFRGNPACVLEPLEAWPRAARMQQLAAENNQAETAFLLKTADPARFGLRWFTPTVEVPLCGHATLASSHALFAELGLSSPKVTFDTQSGPLTVERADSGYRMDFPARPAVRIEALVGLAEALGFAPLEIWAGPFVVAIAGDEATVRGAAPNLAAIKTICASATGERGNVGVSALAAPGGAYDVVSRFFAPGSGIPEDPTTGGLHCTLAPLFAEKLGRQRLRFHQAYPGRGGDLVCEARGARVWLEGAAVTVSEGRLRHSL